jgi:pimeloyl-ACP methyl ester carboxylesterase
MRLDGYRSHYVPTSAGRVHVLDALGHGPLPPVVLLHGLSSAGVHFLPLLRRLRGHVRRVVAPDLLAHGFSDSPPVMRAELMKSALVAALDDVLDEPSVVYGNSMGGLAAVRYALARPAQVRGLVLSSPGGAAMDDAELRRFASGFSLTSHDEALGFVDRMLARKSRFRQLLAWGVRRQFGDPRVRALLSALAPADLLQPEELAALPMRVLLVWGRDERVLPREHFEFFRRHLPGDTRIEQPEGFGHAPYLDDVGAVARQILAFVAEVEGGSLMAAPRSFQAA